MGLIALTDTLMAAVPPSPLMSSDIAASYLQCHPRTLAEWRIAGNGPKYVRVGRRAFYRQPDLDAWLEARVYHSTADETHFQHAGERSNG